MRVYIIKRLLTVIPVILIIGIFVFLLLHLIPGDPAMVFVGEDADPDVVEQIRKEMGLDRPLYIQFYAWFSKVLMGDLGKSIIYERKVLDLILERLPVTLTLGFFSMLFSLAISIPSGIISAVHQNTYRDYLFTLLAVMGVSIPGFWLALMFILFFSVRLDWFPAIGYVSIFENFLPGLRYLILPSVSQGIITAAIVARMTRSSMLEVLRQDYIATARGKGLPAKWVVYKHALKNAMAPTLTVIGFQLGNVLGGSVITEIIFTLPGVGQLIFLAISNRDYPVVQGCILLIAFGFVIINLFVDILYFYLDPRITYEE